MPCDAPFVGLDHSQTDPIGGGRDPKPLVSQGFKSALASAIMPHGAGADEVQNETHSSSHHNQTKKFG